MSDPIRTFEMQLLGWAKSTSKKGPTVTFLLQSDEDVEYFEAFTVAKGKMAGQIFDIAVSISKQDPQSTEREEQKPKPQGLYGPQSMKLRQSGFFRVPDVWRAIGTDEEFRAWVQRQPSCVSGEWSEWLEEIGEGRCIAAHVRRADESGTGYRAPYACIPLTDKEHTQYQHQGGESALYRYYLEVRKGECRGQSMPHLLVQEAKEWFDRKRIDYVERWAWYALKTKLGYEHWSDIHPHILFKWADGHSLARYLPAEYRV